MNLMKVRMHIMYLVITKQAGWLIIISQLFLILVT